jgi:serine phosphatase RsbU (regulator of sigma subunit)
VPEVRRAVQSVDPSQPIHDVATMEQIVAQSLSVERVGSLMVTFFAGAALLMATLGLYGVVSYSVRQGTVEIGTRMALGAAGRDLLAMIVGGGLRIAGVGIALGVLISAAVGGLLAHTFAIGPSVLPYLGSMLVVAGVAGIASFFPALRATRVSPMVAIRNEPGSTWLSARGELRRALRGLSSAVVRLQSEPTPDVGLVAEFVAAARGSGSYGEAFQRALETLCVAAGATSAFLFERGAGGYTCVSRTPPGDAVLAIPEDGLLINRLRFYRHALPLGPADVELWRQWTAGRPPRAAEVEVLASIGARLAAALRAGPDILGILVLGPPSNRPSYGDADRHLVRHCADQLTLMIENARLTGRVVEQEKLRRDLALAAEVQQRLLPEQAPVRAAATLAGVSVPARSVGGDYYDFLDLGDHRVGIALADVSGKGVPAALIMAVVQASLRIVAADRDVSLPQLAARINDCVYRSTQSKSYATFFYAQLDEQSRRLRYVNAGHLPPYLVRAVPVPVEGQAGPAEIQELPASGTVVGLFPEMSYDEASVDLHSGDVLVAFTDGVTEALNAAEEEYGDDRLKALLREVAPFPASEISARIASALRAWIGATAQYDDLTFVVLKVT